MGKIMYVYLIKYNNNVIAAADGDVMADKIIKQYIQHNKTMEIDKFEKEPIRFFTELLELEEDSIGGIKNQENEG